MIALALTDEQQKLVEENRGLVHEFANKYRTHEAFEDIQSAGYAALTRAAMKYDPGSGVKFSTYAWMWVRGGVNRAVKKEIYDPVARWSSPVFSPSDEIEHHGNDEDTSDFSSSIGTTVKTGPHGYRLGAERELHSPRHDTGEAAIDKMGELGEHAALTLSRAARKLNHELFDRLLAGTTEAEREAFEIVHGLRNGKGPQSYSRAAKHLGRPKSTTHYQVRRAERKVRENARHENWTAFRGSTGGNRPLWEDQILAAVSREQETPKYQQDKADRLAREGITYTGKISGREQ